MHGIGRKTDEDNTENTTPSSANPMNEGAGEHDQGLLEYDRREHDHRKVTATRSGSFPTLPPGSSASRLHHAAIGGRTNASGEMVLSTMW